MVCHFNSSPTSVAADTPNQVASGCLLLCVVCFFSKYRIFNFCQLFLIVMCELNLTISFYTWNSKHYGLPLSDKGKEKGSFWSVLI